MELENQSIWGQIKGCHYTCDQISSLLMKLHFYIVDYDEAGIWFVITLTKSVFQCTKGVGYHHNVGRTKHLPAKILTLTLSIECKKLNIIYIYMFA